MSIPATVVTAARGVRAACLALALALLVGFVAVQAFASQYGIPVHSVQLDSLSTNDSVLTSAIAAQEAAGLHCTTKPNLTDVILFQQARGTRVEVLTFAEAINASAAKTGWIRRYCV